MYSTKLEITNTLKCSVKMVVYTIMFVPFVLVSITHKIVNKIMYWSADFDKY